MKKEEFKKICPNLYESMQNKTHAFKVYDIQIKSHTPLTKIEIINHFENFNVFRFYNHKITGQKPNLCTSDKPFLMVLN